MRIIIPGAETGKFRVLVVQPTGKPERLESGIRVADNYTILVVFDALAMNPSASRRWSVGQFAYSFHQSPGLLHLFLSVQSLKLAIEPDLL